MTQVLLFSLGCRRYALPLDLVQEIVEAPRLHYIPRAGGDYLGAMNFHGRILPVLDLAAWLHEESDRRDSRVIVLATERCALALAVTAVGKITESSAPVFEGDEAPVLLDITGLLAQLAGALTTTGGEDGA